MQTSTSHRRLIVNADDFGRSQSINQAVILAHQEGILTSASLMVNEPGFDEAVQLAREHPRLGVGLHLTLLCGHSSLSRDEIPALVNEHRELPDSPVAAGFRYFVSPGLRDQLRDELATQFQRFLSTGLELDHVNGHLHFHMHPTVFGLLMENAAAWGITRLRLTWDPFWFNSRLAGGHWLYRAGHSAIFRLLAGLCRPHLRRRGIRHSAVVFGLLQNARVDEAYVTRLLAALPPGASELYSHPSLDEFKNELDALVSQRVKAQVRARGIQLIRYQDL